MAEQAWFWLAVFVLCFALEGGALFYQHVLHIYPCEICIYVRVWVLGIALISLLALYVKRWFVLRVLACLASLALSLGLSRETWNLIVVEYNLGDGGSCSFFANFPEWAPLDKWLPAFFEVQEFCKATPELLFGITMTHALAVVSLVFVGTFAAVFVGTLFDRFEQ